MRQVVLAIVFIVCVAAAASAQKPLSVPATGAAGEQQPSSWNLADDVLSTGNQISFNQGSRGVWYFLESHDFSHDVFTYRLLPEYRSPCSSKANGRLDPVGISCWRSSDMDASGNHLPLVAVNATDTALQSPDQFAIPAHSTYMHPGFDRLAIIAWKSPVNGNVTVRGSFSDLDPNCDNGVLWSIDRGSTTVRSGDLANGGAEGFNFRIRVNVDDVLYFVVHPKQGDYACDTTGLDLTIGRGR